MDLNSLKLTLLIGLLFWGGWPLIANASNITDPIVRGFLVSIVAALGFAPFLPGRISFRTFASLGAVLLMIAGVFNFAGHLLFPKLQVVAGGQLSFYMPLILALCILTSAIGGALFYGESFSWPKTLCLLWILSGVVAYAFVSIGNK